MTIWSQEKNEFRQNMKKTSPMVNFRLKTWNLPLVTGYNINLMLKSTVVGILYDTNKICSACNCHFYHQYNFTSLLSFLWNENLALSGCGLFQATRVRCAGRCSCIIPRWYDTWDLTLGRSHSNVASVDELSLRRATWRNTRLLFTVWLNQAFTIKLCDW